MVIDTGILQNKVTLRSYWYCMSQPFDIVIEIGIAHLKKMVFIPILILLDKPKLILILELMLQIHSFSYCYWYCNLGLGSSFYYRTALLT